MSTFLKGLAVKCAAWLQVQYCFRWNFLYHVSWHLFLRTILSPLSFQRDALEAVSVVITSSRTLLCPLWGSSTWALFLRQSSLGWSSTWLARWGKSTAMWPWSVASLRMSSSPRKSPPGGSWTASTMLSLGFVLGEYKFSCYTYLCVILSNHDPLSA